MAKTKRELITLALQRGVTVPVGASKSQVEDLLAEPTDLEQIAPMLCKNFLDLPIAERQPILHDDSWAAEPKLDGIRVKVHLTDGGIRLDTRRRSEVTFNYHEVTNRFPHLNVEVPSRYWDLVLDGELILPQQSIDTGTTKTFGSLGSTMALVSSSPQRAIELQRRVGLVELHLFDLIAPRPTLLRKMHLDNIISEIGNKWWHLVHGTYQKEKLYKHTILHGGEGVVLKYLPSEYQVGKRSPFWLKWKRTTTVDCFVTGYVAGTGKYEGMIGSLIVSAITPDGTTTEIGAVPPGTDQVRNHLSSRTGELLPQCYGKVVEVEAQEWTKNHRLRHARLIRWRPDKTAKDCVIQSTHPKLKPKEDDER